jgi:hypothetical protein
LHKFRDPEQHNPILSDGIDALPNVRIGDMDVIGVYTIVGGNFLKE